MKIINVNKGSEKIKYEIYRMHLNRKKSKRYREELAKNIKFYRLNARSDLDTNTKYLDCTFQRRKIITFEKWEAIRIAKENIDYEGNFNFNSFPKGVKLYPYDEVSVKNSQKQKDFIKQYIHDNLETYSFDFSPYSDGDKCKYYIFLGCYNLYGNYRNYHNYNKDGYCNDVVVLSNEMVALYLLQLLEEKDDSRDLEIYLGECLSSLRLNDRNLLMKNVQFVKEATVTETAMETLINMEIVSESNLEEKISLNRVFAPYLKK